MNTKRVVGTVFALQLAEGRAATRDLAAKLGCDTAEIAKKISELRSMGLVEGSGSRLRITKKGRAKVKVVFIGGGFEVIHPGHLHTILQAKRLGDVLVAVLARDSTIRRRKGREPVSTEEERLTLLSSLRAVDAAILGVEGDIYTTLERVSPDVVALGYDQYHGEKEIVREAEARGMRVKVVRLKPAATDVKTSRLLEELG